MFCSQCGKEIRDGVKFCGFCGATTKRPDSSQNPAPFPNGGFTAARPMDNTAPMGHFGQAPQNIPAAPYQNAPLNHMNGQAQFTPNPYTSAPMNQPNMAARPYNPMPNTPGVPTAPFPGTPVNTAANPYNPMPNNPGVPNAPYPGTPANTAANPYNPMPNNPGVPTAPFPGTPANTAANPYNPMQNNPGVPTASFPGTPVNTAANPYNPMPNNPGVPTAPFPGTPVNTAAAPFNPVQNNPTAPTPSVPANTATSPVTPAQEKPVVPTPEKLPEAPKAAAETEKKPSPVLSKDIPEQTAPAAPKTAEKSNDGEEKSWEATVAVKNRGRTDTQGAPIDTRSADDLPGADLPKDGSSHDGETVLLSGAGSDTDNGGEEQEKTTPKGFKNRKKFIIIGASALVGLGAAGGVAAYFLTSNSSVDKLVELGNKYLDDGEYDKAIIEFEKAINLDDTCAEAYIGIAKAYIGLGKPDIAKKYLQDGYDKTGDPEIKKMLDELNGGSDAPVDVSTAEVTTEPIAEPAGATYSIVTVAPGSDSTGHFNDVSGSFQGSGSDIFAVECNGRYRLSTVSGAGSTMLYSYISPFFGEGGKYAFVSTTWDGKRRYSSSNISWIIDRDGNKVMGIPPCYNVWWGSSPDPVVVVQDYGGYRISGIDGKNLYTLPAEFVTENSDVPKFLRSGFKSRSKELGTGSVMTTGCSVFNGEIYFTFTELHEKNGSNSAMYYTYKLKLDGSDVSFEEYNVTAETGAAFPVYDDGTDKISAINAGDMFQLVKTSGSSSKFCGCGPTDTDMQIAKVFDSDHVLICRTTSDGVVSSTEYAVYKPEWYNSEYETAAQSISSWTKLSDWYQDISKADDSVWVAQTSSGSTYLDSGFNTISSYKHATKFSGGVAIACTGSTGVLINKEGQTISEEFPCESAQALSDGYFSILADGRYSIVRAVEQ